MTRFNDAVNSYFPKLETFTLAITRAHGKNHPEAFEVRNLFTTIQKKTKESGANKLNLDVEFTQLRDVTNNYAVPGDVCDTYAAVYKLLSETDQAYQA